MKSIIASGAYHAQPDNRMQEPHNKVLTAHKDDSADSYLTRPDADWERSRDDIDVQDTVVSQAEPHSSERVAEQDTFSISKVSQDLIRKALEKYNGNRKKAAEELGISERTLYRKLPQEFRNLKKED